VRTPTNVYHRRLALLRFLVYSAKSCVASSLINGLSAFDGSWVARFASEVALRLGRGMNLPLSLRCIESQRSYLVQTCAVCVR
jgi:hypothetical protein